MFVHVRVRLKDETDLGVYTFRNGKVIQVRVLATGDRLSNGLESSPRGASIGAACESSCFSLP